MKTLNHRSLTSTPRKLLRLAALLPLLAFAPACGGPVKEICDLECDCESCSDDGYDKCIDDGNRIQDDSEDAGCRSEFEAYSECVKGNHSCNSGSWSINGCGLEESNLESCFARSNGGI